MKSNETKTYGNFMEFVRHRIITFHRVMYGNKHYVMRHLSGLFPRISLIYMPYINMQEVFSFAA